mmetsp:Transcript_20189/g.41924  ORF Transcript_20189/g.41924 Transcript_20189/m.41924 type:complete len:93 (+) Transcript_20189:641-919(+)
MLYLELKQRGVAWGWAAAMPQQNTMKRVLISKRSDCLLGFPLGDRQPTRDFDHSRLALLKGFHGRRNHPLGNIGNVRGGINRRQDEIRNEFQ